MMYKRASLKRRSRDEYEDPDRVGEASVDQLAFERVSTKFDTLEKVKMALQTANRDRKCEVLNTEFVIPRKTRINLSKYEEAAEVALLDEDKPLDNVFVAFYDKEEKLNAKNAVTLVSVHASLHCCCCVSRVDTNNNNLRPTGLKCHFNALL